MSSTPSTEIVKLEVSRARSSAIPTPNKRRVIPIVELSSAKGALVLDTRSRLPASVSLTQGVEMSIQDYHAPKLLFPEGVAQITHVYVHDPHRCDPSQGSEIKAPWHTKHVLLPYDLRDRRLNIQKDEIQKLLNSIFPGTLNVAEGRSYLVFQVRELPSPPWPLTIGGKPFTLLSEGGQGRGLMFPSLYRTHPHTSICQSEFTEALESGMLSDKALRTITATLVTRLKRSVPEARVHEVMFTSDRIFYIFVDNDFCIGGHYNRLPGTVAGCPASYHHVQELNRPARVDLPAWQMTEPQQVSGIVDETSYDPLRPGVMVCSSFLGQHDHPYTFPTGVLVENEHGARLMTAASHGIIQHGTLSQPHEQDRAIGRAVSEVPHTDISLVELGPEKIFVNETFVNGNGVTPQFSRFLTSEEVTDWQTYYFNSPFTGNMEGVMTMKSARVVNKDYSDERRLKYVVYHWAYLGQQEGLKDEYKVIPPAGTCGSAVWNDDGIVCGFYHSAITEGPWKGHIASVSSSELTEAKYKIVAS